MLMRSPFRKSRKEGSTLREGVPRHEGVPPVGGVPSKKGTPSLKGFTLVEVMIAVIIVGVGISAAMYGLTSSMTTSHEGRGILVAGIWQIKGPGRETDLLSNVCQLAGGFEQRLEEFGVNIPEHSLDQHFELASLSLVPLRQIRFSSQFCNPG